MEKIKLSKEEVENYTRKLNESKNFGDIFELVKEIVFKAIKMRRAGLSLYLADIPKYILAYHIIGSNTIVINRAILEALNKIEKNKINKNSYIFVVLLHEYLHSLGIYDEKMIERIIYLICINFFGKKHPTSEMTEKGILEVFPELRKIKIKFSKKYELVKDFDRSSINYIS